MSTKILLIGGTNVDGAPSGLGKGISAPGRAREGDGQVRLG